jgi:hypothetical protein
MNIITVDLGGTNTRIARAINPEKAEFSATPVRRQNTHNYEEDLKFVIDMAKELRNGGSIDALGIGIPGRVNDDKTDMVGSNNLPEWANRSFCDDIAKALNCPVYMDNDGVAAGIGEGYFGQIHDNFHYLIWGTGISSVAVAFKDDGSIDATYVRRTCHEFFETWENDCGGAAFMRKYGKPGEQLTSAEWTTINSQFANYLREYIELAKPPAIVFGGGLAMYHAETVTNHANEMGVPIQITQFGEDSGLVGGLGLVRHGIVSAKPRT